MFKSLLMAAVLLGLAGESWSQLDSARAEPLTKAPPAKPASDEPQQRRAAVREALEAQREKKSSTTTNTTNGEAAPRPTHQLSPQERLELRQQLRQQRS